MMDEMHGIKSQTDNQWTFYDWTPTFTTPPYSFSCPPIEYLAVEEIPTEASTKWVIRSLIQRSHYADFLGDIAPFLEPVSAWEAEWPHDIPQPDGASLRPGTPYAVLPEHDPHDPTSVHKAEITAEMNYKDYLFSGEFRDMQLVTRRNMKGTKNILLDSSTPISSAAAEHPSQCGLSESGRHYGMDHAPFLFWERGVSITCNYDLRMHPCLSHDNYSPVVQTINLFRFIQKQYLLSCGTCG
jgi:hypothetical protein